MTEPIDLALQPHLLLESGEAVEIPLSGEIAIGRDAACALRIEDDERVSRRHARVWREHDRCWIEDLGSQNGTHVNEERLTGPRALEDRDRIRVCAARLMYVADPTSSAAPEIVSRLDASADPLPGRLQSLLAISEAVSILEDERDIARRLLDLALPAVRGERGMVLVSERSGQLRSLEARYADGTLDPDPPHSRTVLRAVLTDKLALLTRDAQADSRLRKTAESRPASSIQGQRVSSLCCVPLLAHGEVLGVLQVTSPEAEWFGAEELSFLTGAARVAALAFRAARVQSERTRVIAELTATQMDLRVRAEQFRLLYRLEHQLSTTQDVGLFLSSVAHQAVVALNATAGSIFLVDEATGRIRFAYPAGGKEREVLHQTFERGRGFVGHVVESGQPVLENDVAASPHFDLELAQKFGMVPRQLVAVPLVAPRENTPRVIGALEVLDRKEGAFTAADQQLLTFLAAQVSTALQRMRLQEERERRERLATIGRMASSIIHDLRSPLTVVAGYLDVLETRDIQPSDRARMSKIVRRSVRRIGTMLREVLEFARDRVLIAREPVDPTELLAEVAEEVQADLTEANVKLDMRVDGAETIDVDADRLRRVLLNLVSNALDAMASDRVGVLTLTCARGTDGVRLEVADTGPGIPADLRPRLFTPFATSGKKDGTGLGLSICQSIVHAHGGTIHAEDVQPRGTRFVIKLPG